MIEKKIKKSFIALSKFEETAKKLIVDQVQKGIPKDEIDKQLQNLIYKACASIDSSVDKGMLFKGLKASTRTWLTVYLAEYNKYKRRAVSIAKKLITTPEGKKLVTEVFEEKRRRVIKMPKLDDDTLLKVYQKYGQLEERNKVHGFIGGKDYHKELTKRLEDLTRMDPKSAPEDATRHYSSAYAKIERDIRHGEQMQMVDRALTSGNPLQWISSHADCSKRCKDWQGKLVHMTAPPINSKMETGMKEGGYTVYSFKGITEQEDKHGYKNNVIVGFNCRHFLIPYSAGSHPPAKYKEDTIRTERRITQRQRRMEKNIRKFKYQYELTKDVDPKKAKELRKRWLALRKEYIEFSKANNAAYYPYRLY